MRASGHFTLTATTAIYTDRSLSRVAQQFARFVEPATGYTLAVHTGSAPAGNRIVLHQNVALQPTLGTEGYRLVVRPGAVTITASSAAGAFYALQTLKQLLPADIFREATIDNHDWTAPAVTSDEWTLTPSDSTITFMHDMLTEVMGLFPSRFIHIGGDEVVQDQWKASAAVQTRMRRLGITTEDALQVWFVKQMDAFLIAHGRRPVMWDESLDSGQRNEEVVDMSWHDSEGGLTAARQGHDAVMAPWRSTYLDQADLSIAMAYAFTPILPQLESKVVHHILGGQAELWTGNTATTPRQIEHQVYPRLCALAEAMWTPPTRKDFANFQARLPGELVRLNVLDVNYSH